MKSFKKMDDGKFYAEYNVINNLNNTVLDENIFIFLNKNDTNKDF